MDSSLIDEYVYSVLVDNGLTEKRDFPLADSWIEKIEQKVVCNVSSMQGKLYTYSAA